MKCSLLVLSSYLDGELEARRQGELEAHLVGCQRCRAGLGYLREEVERVGALGRVHVADHSVHSLLSQLGLIEEDQPLPERSGAVGLAERPSLPWESTAAEPLRWAPQPMPTLPPPVHEERSVDMTGSPMRHAEPVVEEPAAAAAVEEPAALAEEPAALAAESPVAAEEPAAFADPPAPPAVAPPAEPDRPSFRWVAASDAPAAQSPPTPPPMTWPPPAATAPDAAPSALPSGGAFPPGGPEPSDPSTHVTASGGEPEMTASPPWAPDQAPAGPVYPLTDDDVLDAPLPVDRFGPPVQASRPSLFERLRDRLAVRRTLSRSTSAYDDAVQIVSGSGAAPRRGRARLEVERRRHEALRGDTGDVAALPGMAQDAGDPGDEVDLGPLPPPLPPLSTPMPRPPFRPVPHPGQMALPGTEVGDPLRRSSLDDPRAPIHRVPMPPPRHTLGSALGDVPPPPLPPPPAMPPPPPTPDSLGEALAGLDREGGATASPARPWRPREILEDLAPAEAGAPPRRFAAASSAAPSRHVPSPSQLRDGRRLLALFGAATLLMLVVGVVSGKTTSPLPSSTATHSAAPAPVHHPQAVAPQTHPTAAPGKITLGPQPSQAPAAGTPQLTGLKQIGDGGSGYQVRDFRYGIHPNDFRIVLDMDASGAASGTPKAVIGFQDSTTLLLVIGGVLPAGSTGQLPAGSPVVSVTQVSPSPYPGAVTYQVKLAHAMTFTAGYATGPLRLVLDLAG